MIKKIVLLLVILFSVNSIAQKNNISPYSFFDIGEQNEVQSVNEANMGGIGAAQNSLYQLHFTNPASYGSLRLTTYALAGNNRSLTIDDGSDTQSSSSFNLSYLALGFPVGEKAGVVFGVQPFSKVGYSISNNISDTESNLFFGEGGTNRVFLGYGHKLPYDISIGIEGAYTFGTIERRILNRVEDVFLATRHETNSEISGFSIKVGLQHKAKITEKLNLHTGAVFHLENNLTAKGNERLFSLLNVSNPDLVLERDEILNASFDTEINSPLRTILSAGVGTSRWYAGVQYSFQDPVLFKDDVLQSTNVEFTQRSTIALGGHYTPKAESLTNYWQRITYRAGVYRKDVGLKINNQEIDDFGMSFGLTLPSKRKLSNINLGFDVGRRGETGNDLIKENYVNFRISLSFSDQWFKKRKLN